MPPTEMPLGNDELAVPAYFAFDPTDPELAAWKIDHPDWIEVGTWVLPDRTEATRDGTPTGAEREARAS